MKLNAEWAQDPPAILAAKVLDDPSFSEAPALAVWCTRCAGKKRRLLRVFWARHSDEGPRPHLLVPGFSLRDQKIPPRCWPAPTTGELWKPPYGHCSRCRKGVAVMYPSAALGDPDSKVGGYIGINFDGTWSDEPKPGDLFTIGKVESWEPGPVGSILLWLDSPTVTRVGT